nr:GNAT family N-acetyltransferase [Paracoccus salsus]
MQLAAAFEATWPAAEYRDVGGFRVGRGHGAGARVSSARAIGPWRDADIDASVDLHSLWGQEPLFRVPDDDTALSAALRDRGFRLQVPTAIMATGIERLTGLEPPPVTTFAVWPPLAIQRQIWAAGHIGPARQQVMERASHPKAAILGRIDDRAAGAGFVAIHAGIAMMHAVEVLPEWRRKGLAGWMMRGAAIWAAGKGATRLALAVSRDNQAAIAFYRNLGFEEVAGYGYRIRP